MKNKGYSLFDMINNLTNITDTENVSKEVIEDKAIESNKEIKIPVAVIQIMLEGINHLIEHTDDNELLEKAEDTMRAIEFELGINFDEKVVKCRRGLCKVEAGYDAMSAAIELNK